MLNRNRVLFEAQQGQALTELIIVLPLVFLLLTVSLDWTHAFARRFMTDSQRLDEHLRESLGKEELAVRRLSQSGCKLSASSIWTSAQSKRTSWPTEIDHQRAFSSANQRLACLSEGTARLGGPAALPVWTVLIKAPTELAAKTAAHSLCPLTVGLAERLRAAAIVSHRTATNLEFAQARKLERASPLACR